MAAVLPPAAAVLSPAAAHINIDHAKAAAHTNIDPDIAPIYCCAAFYCCTYQYRPRQGHEGRRRQGQGDCRHPAQQLRPAAV
jgi:hypothetical protein